MADREHLTRPLLVVMRRANMARVHPRMVVSLCDRCAAPVGIYPSGQAMLRRFPVLEVVCEICHGPVTRARLAPGALEEKAESVPDSHSG
jgi:hypothetical protein